MSSYWDNKWANAQNDWEEKRVQLDDVEGVLGGLEPLRRKKSASARAREIQLLDVGNNIGRSGLVAPAGEFAVDPIDGLSLINLVSDDAKGTVVSVALTNLVPDEPVPGLPPVNAGLVVLKGTHALRANVQFGNSGHQAQAIIDFSRGCVFSVPAAFLRVNAFALDTGAVAPDAPALVGAFASYLPISGGLPQLTLLRLDEISGAVFPLAPAASGEWPVPYFAESLAVYRTNAAATVAPAIRIRYQNGASVIGIEERATDIPWGASTILPNTCNRIVVLNIDGVESVADIALVFKLKI